jgi:putative endonuclease
MGHHHDTVMYVYIMSGHTRRLYTGVTNDLERRVWEHKERTIPGFTSRYKFHRLVFYEVVEGAQAAIEREKQIKGWKRWKKLDLIETANPGWGDLSAGWFRDAG